MSESANYLFGYTEEEARRLARQAAFIEDLTADVLRRAGLKAGMRVLDLGCGVGDVSLLAANMVGATGAVLGIDRSAASIETARRRTAASHIGNVIFAAAELDAFDTDQTFDAVIGRLVLLYQRDPSAILRRFRRFLKPGGLVAFQEMDVQLHLQVPASQLFTKVFSWIIGGHKADGSETNMGSKLHATFLKAGLPRPTMIMAARAESGPDSYTYAHLAGVIRSMLPLLERTGLATAEEVAIDTLAARLQQEAIASECVTFSPALVGAWVRLPN